MKKPALPILAAAIVAALGCFSTRALAQQTPPPPEQAQQPPPADAANAAAIQACGEALSSVYGPRGLLAEPSYVINFGAKVDPHICNNPQLWTPQGRQAFVQCSDDYWNQIYPIRPKGLGPYPARECVDPKFQANLPQLLSCMAKTTKAESKFSPYVSAFVCTGDPDVMTSGDGWKKFDACYKTFRSWHAEGGRTYGEQQTPANVHQLFEEWNKPAYEKYRQGKMSDSETDERNSVAEAISLCAGPSTGARARSSTMLACVKSYRSPISRVKPLVTPERVYEDCSRNLGFSADVSGTTSSSGGGNATGNGPGSGTGNTDVQQQ